MIIIGSIYKKGEPINIKNYGGIALLTHGTQFCLLQYYNKLENYLKNIMEKYQIGLTNRKSTTDHTFTARQILDNLYEFGKEVHICFVDFSQAYNSLNRDKFGRNLAEFEIPTKLFRLIK